MDEKYCSTCFKTGEELDAALQKALECNDNAERAEAAANRAETTVTEALAEAKASGEFDGEDGYTPVKGVDYCDGEDGYTPVKGVDYFDGQDGVTPHIGANGNWFIGETDTGVAAHMTPPASVDLSAFESDGIIVENHADGSQTTYKMEFDDNGNPVKITDSNGHETTLTW